MPQPRPAFATGTRAWDEFCDQLAERVVLTNGGKTAAEQANQFWQQVGRAYAVVMNGNPPEGLGSGAALTPLLFVPIVVLDDNDLPQARRDVARALRRFRNRHGPG